MTPIDPIPQVLLVCWLLMIAIDYWEGPVQATDRRRRHMRLTVLMLATLLVAPAAAAEKPTKVTRPIVVQEAVSPAKARRLAQTLWPELSQAEVDGVTARAKAIGPTTVRIFCFDEVKCGDLASSLENAFESARWTVLVRYTPSMIPEGMQASPKALQALGGIDPGFSLTKQDDPEPVESITIGTKPRGRLE